MKKTIAYFCICISFVPIYAMQQKNSTDTNALINSIAYIGNSFFSMYLVPHLAGKDIAHMKLVSQSWHHMIRTWSQNRLNLINHLYQTLSESNISYCKDSLVVDLNNKYAYIFEYTAPTTTIQWHPLPFPFIKTDRTRLLCLSAYDMEDLTIPAARSLLSTEYYSFRKINDPYIACTGTYNLESVIYYDSKKINENNYNTITQPCVIFLSSNGQTYIHNIPGIPYTASIQKNRNKLKLTLQNKTVMYCAPDRTITLLNAKKINQHKI